MFNKTPAPGDAGQHTTEPPCETLGCYLKATRLSQGLELTVIADETRIDIKNLTALEEDNREALPADVFTRGFVRLYASHLNIDQQEAIRRYEQQWGTDRHSVFAPMEMINPSRSFWPGIAIAVTLITILFGVRLFWPEPPADTNSTVAPAISSQAISQEPDSQSPPEVKTALPSPEKDPAATPLLQQIPAGTEAPPYEIILTCSGEMPLTITLDGTRTTESVCPPNSPQTWKAAKGFDLTLGSASGATLTINGVTVPLMAAGGQSITIHRP